MPKGKLTMLGLALSASLTLAGCGKTTVSAASQCSIFRPITWSVDDTDPTIRQVKAHNAAGKVACGWAP